jgi:hypothetical protein
VTLSLAGSSGAGGMGRRGGGIGIGGGGGDGGGDGGGSVPFAQLEVVAAPVAGSLSPAMTPSAGGGVLWLAGANLRGGGGGGGDLGVAAAVASASGGAVSAAAALVGAVIRAVSSAVASFEAPPTAVGPAALSLALGGGGRSSRGGVQSFAAGAEVGRCRLTVSKVQNPY